MPETEPIKSAELTERRQANWQETSLILMQAGDKHVKQSYIEDCDESKVGQREVDVSIAVVKALIEADINIDSDKLRHLEVLLRELELLKEAVYEHKLQGANINGLVESWPEAEAADVFKVKLDQHEDSRTIDLISRRRRYLLGLADSHRATYDLILQARQHRFITGMHTAVLSFDHHADVFYPKRYDDPIEKNGLVSGLLDCRLISAAAVIGPFDTPDQRSMDQHRRQGHNINIVHCDSLYSGSKPVVASFESALREILQFWKMKNIRQIYPSIDLDGLRLSEIGYTAVDYVSFLELKRILFKAYRYFTMLQNAESTPDERERLLRTLVDLICRDHPRYYGLPASWPLRALEIARDEYGFEIGLRHPSTGQRLVGDITEFTGYDYQGHTAKITRALANGLLHIAQHQ
jgi:hypothetical protein